MLLIDKLSAAGRRHLEEVKMTYVQHALFSLSLAGDMALGAVCATVHAICPGIFITSSTDISCRLSEKIKQMAKAHQ